MERVISYIESSPYGRLHDLKGFEGMVEYFAVRKEIELRLIEKLPMEVHIINNMQYHWDQVWAETEAILKNIINK